MNKKIYVMLTSLICILFIIFHAVNKYLIIPYYLDDLGLNFKSTNYFYYISYGVLIATIIYVLILEFIMSKFKKDKFKNICLYIAIFILSITINILTFKVLPQYLRSKLNLQQWQYPFLFMMVAFSSIYPLLSIYVINKLKNKFFIKLEMF